VSSFGEKKALKFAREDPKAFLRHNQRRLSRIYPAGGRIDSSNYDPMTMWTVGSQLGTVVSFGLLFYQLLFPLLRAVEKEVRGGNLPRGPTIPWG